MESRLIVHSWDFDGMLASREYADALKAFIIAAAREQRSINKNDYDKLANFIINKYSLFFDKKLSHDPRDKHIVYIGSDRQDATTDLNNGYKARGELYVTLSCYPFFSSLVEALSKKYKAEISLETLLLEDIYHREPAGTSFTKMQKIYLNLSAKFYGKLAEQLTHMDTAIAWQLFDELKQIVTTDGNTKERNARLPQYTDKSKLLIMFAQIHHANAKYGTRRLIEFCYADDRNDILCAAEINLQKLLPFIPATAHIFLEQFIPPEIKETVQGADPILFADFKQNDVIVGKSKKTASIDVIFRNIADTHDSLNVIFTDPVPTVLTETISKSSQDQALMYIQLCINRLDHTNQPKGVTRISKLLLQDDTNSNHQTNLVKLTAIIKIADSKLTSKSKEMASSSFFKENMKIVTLYKAIQNLNASNPDTAELEAAYHVIQQPSVPETKQLGSLRKNSFK